MTEPLDRFPDAIVNHSESTPELNSGLLTRRSFAQIAGAVSASLLTQSSLASSIRYPTLMRRSIVTGLALVGTSANNLNVFSTNDSRWRLEQIVSVPAPIGIVFHPSGQFAYVLNEVSEFLGLPTGSLESYSINPVSKKITLLGRQPLSMSAIMPRGLAIDPSGNHLVVAVHGGGSYNLLPIMSDGQAGKVRSILKETGSGPVAGRQQSAHPHSVIFDGTGNNVISSDSGSDRVNVIALRPDAELPRKYKYKHMLKLCRRKEMLPGSGPTHIALHPAGDLLYVANELNSSLIAFSYDKDQAILSAKLPHKPIDHDARHWDSRDSSAPVDAMSFDHTGNFLYVAQRNSLERWKVDRATGVLTAGQSATLGKEDAKSLSIHPSRHELLAATAEGVLRIDYSDSSGSSARADLVASVQGAQALAVQYQ